MSAIRASASLSGFKGTVRQINISKKPLSPTKLQLFCPGGFPYEAFDGKAYITPWSLMKMIENARISAFHDLGDGSGHFLDAHRIYSTHFQFMVATRTQISTEFYDTSRPKYPLKFHVSLAYVGKTSMKLLTEMFMPDNELPVCKNEAHSVLIDQKTIKPARLPDWWLEKFKLSPEENGTPLNVNLPPSAKAAGSQVSEFTFPLTVSDVDGYGHANWCHYIKFFHNAYFDKLVRNQGVLKASSAANLPKEFSIAFLKEAVVGDEILVKSWETTPGSHSYNFQACKGPDVISEASVCYYPEDSV